MGELYTGVKFEVVHLPAVKISDPRIRELIKVGKELAEKGFCPANSGNLSFRSSGGFVITRAGSELGKLTAKDFVPVKDVDTRGKRVFAAGRFDPSSESMMHFMIYAARPDVTAVLHAHALHLKNAVATKKAYPYATLECAESAVEVLERHDLVILRGHGFVAVGTTAEEAFQRVF